MRKLLTAAAVLTVLTAIPSTAQQVSTTRMQGFNQQAPRGGQWSQHRTTVAPRGGFKQNFVHHNSNAASTSRAFAHSNANAMSNTRVVVRGNRHGIGNGGWGSRQGHVRFNGHNQTGWQTRWGNRIGGRWYAGVDAPGGWKAYRRPVRGWQLPRYWAAPSFTIFDYASYGLGAPTPGYSWTRYYDDALLIDDGGHVHDSVSGIDWDGGYADERHASDGYVGDDGAAGASYEPDERYDERDEGVGGAVVGGVVGGVAGNVIGGAAGNRLAGTLLGAGAGAIVGTAIDRAEDRGRYRHDDRHRAPIHDRQGDVHVERGDLGSDRRVLYSHPREIVQRSHHGVGDHARGYGAQAGFVGGSSYYAVPGTTTVITIQPSVTTTTTTTEYVTEAYRAPKKRAYRVKRRVCACK